MTRMDCRPDNFNSLCRLCATYDAVKLEIFGEEGKERSLVQKIQTCLPFQVSKNDPLPKSLCYRCMYNLENFYDFRMGCVDAVALLESCLKPDGGKNLDKRFAEKRAKIMKHMRRHASRDSDSSMPQLEPQVPLPEPAKPEQDDVVVDESSQSSDSIMPKLPSAVDDDNEDAGGNTDDDIEEIEQDEEADEKIIDIDPADYLESSVSEGPLENSERSNPSKRIKLSSEQNESPKSNAAATTCDLYTCRVCGKAFSSKGHLSLHVRIHNRDESSENNTSASSTSTRATPATQAAAFYRPYRCDLCNKSYSSSKHLWGHVSSNHRGDPAVTCPECHRLFSSVFNLEEHKRSKHGEPVGDSTPEDAEDAKLPIKPSPESDKDSPKKTVAAPKVKIEKGVVDGGEDTLNQNGKRPASQEEVGGNRRKSSKPRKIARALSSDSQNEEAESQGLQCAVCFSAFPSFDKLMEHTKLHHEQQHDAEPHAQVQNSNRTHTCLLCEKNFTQRSSLNRHLQNQHGIDPADLLEKQKESEGNSDADDQPMVEVEVNIKSECIETADDDDQEHHMLAESMLESETVFCCEACIREFTDRSSLWLHMLYTHKEAAASACGLCLKVCGDLDSLSMHLQNCHSASQMLIDKRRYSCTVCMRQHDSRKKLLSHVLIHDVGAAKPEDLIILNSDLYAAEMERDHDQEDEDTSNQTPPGAPVTPSTPAPPPNAAVAAAAAAAANSPFACQICLKIFPNEEKMVKHKQNAHRQDALVHATTGVGTYHLFFRCEMCGVSHQSKSDRWKHVYEQHRGDPNVTCSRSGCEKVFASAELAQEHVKHHSMQGSTPNTCEICGKLWSSRVDYWKHMMGVHSEVVPDTCGVCLKVLPDLPQLMDHVRTRHWPLTGGDYCCDICGRPYSNRSKMSRHRKIHFSLPEDGAEDVGGEEDVSASVKKELEDLDPLPTKKATALDTPSVKEKPIKKAFMGNLHCEGCPDLDFSNREDLVQHRRTDHGMLTCDLCDKFYGRTSHLWKHVNRLHRGNPAVTCSFCGKVSASRAHLAGHVSKMHRSSSAAISRTPKVVPSSKSTKSEKALGPQPCPHCKKVFRNRYRMLRHQKSCSESPAEANMPVRETLSGPVACQQCWKMFDNHSTLRKHERRIHVTYSCELCAAGALPSKTALMEHIMIAHRGAEQLTCSVEGCGLVLRCSADREKHENQHRHSSSTPNTCQLCGELYNNRLRLRKHMVLHHKANVSTICGVCLVVLSTFDELRAHVTSDHAAVLKRPNTCGVCGKTCGSRKKTLVHITRCHGSDVTPCKECLAVFKTEDELKQHVETEHEDEDDSDEENEENDDNDDNEDNDNDDNDQNSIKQEEEVEEVVGEPEKARMQESEENSISTIKSEEEQEQPVINGLQSGPHPCELCDKCFKHRKDLVRHVRNKHTQPEPIILNKFACSVCSEKFPSESALSEHCAEVHSKQHQTVAESRPRRSYKCNLCKESFRMPSQLMRHQKQRHRSDSRPMQCSTCDKTFSNKLVFSKHVALCQKDKSSILQQTLETGRSAKNESKEVPELSSMDVFNGHFLDGGGKDIEQCDQSGSASQGPRPRQNRKVYGGNEGPIHCQLCNKVWPALKHQWQHLIRTHREAAATTCGVCLEICKDYAALSTHLREVHPGHLEKERNNFTCRICGRYHNARSKLELHNAIHLGMEVDLESGSSSFTCSTCFKVFSTEGDLEDHKLTHLPKGMELCPSKPERNGPLTEQGEEEDIQLFVCPSCSLVFPLEKELKKHIETGCEASSSAAGSEEDTRDNAYSCQRCSSVSFSSYISLTKHYKQCSGKALGRETEPLRSSGKNDSDTLTDGNKECKITDRKDKHSLKGGQDGDEDEGKDNEGGIGVENRDDNDEVEEVEEDEEEESDIANGVEETDDAAERNEERNAEDDIVEEETNDSQIEEIEDAHAVEKDISQKTEKCSQDDEGIQQSGHSVSRKAVEELVKDIKDLGSAAMHDTGSTEAKEGF